MTALKYFGRDLVLWRDEAGEFHLQDAFCPHLGAHLGVGGAVEDGCIRCPFHGWTFDGTGACTNIPYSDRLNRKAHVRTYPVVVAQRPRVRLVPPRRDRAALGRARLRRGRHARVLRLLQVELHDPHDPPGDGREHGRSRALPLRARHRPGRRVRELRDRGPHGDDAVEADLRDPARRDRGPHRRLQLRSRDREDLVHRASSTRCSSRRRRRSTTTRRRSGSTSPCASSTTRR